MQNAYFIHELKQFSYSIKAQMRSKKTPSIDNGLMTATSFKFSSNPGVMLENLMFSKLLKLYGRKIFFHNMNKECDFIIHNDNSPLAIQICYDFNDANRDRELQELVSAMDYFNIKKGVIITYDYEESVSDNVQVVPFWKYFSNIKTPRK